MREPKQVKQEKVEPADASVQKYVVAAVDTAPDDDTDDQEYLDEIKGVKLVNGEMSASDFRSVQEELGLTNVEMADELAMKQRAICYFRSGERKIQPPIQKLLRFVCEEYGYTF